MQGTSTASLAGGKFEVSGRYAGKPLTCSGTYNALDSAKTIAMPVTCSDGRHGTVTATRDASGMNGSGHVRLADGSSARFIFGNAAMAREQLVVAAPAERTRQQPPLPDPKWVVAQTRPYLECGRDQAARLAILLPNESPSDIATAADVRCGSKYQAMVRTVRARLAEPQVDFEEIARRNFRDLAISTTLSVRERLLLEQRRRPTPPPADQPKVIEREA
jgi:hypothetical protein